MNNILSSCNAVTIQNGVSASINPYHYRFTINQGINAYTILVQILKINLVVPVVPFYFVVHFNLDIYGNTKTT